MDISWLETFVIAAEEGNFRRAAERLHLSQATVSMQIQKLEEMSSALLFDRVGRNVKLSRAGHRFLNHAKGILTSYARSLEDMASWSQGYERSLQIAVSPLVATTFLPLWIRGFSELHPEVEFAIQVMESSEVERQLTEQGADLGFSRMESLHRHVACESLYDDPVVLVAPRDEHDFEGPVRRIEELLGEYTLFTHTHPNYWDDLLGRLRSEYPGIRTMSVSQGHVVLEWISRGMGISFLPRSTVHRALISGRVEEVPFEAFALPTANTYLLMAPSSSPSAVKFAEFVRAYMSVRPVV